MTHHLTEAEQPHQCFDISHDADLHFDAAPVNDSSYDKTNKFLTLESKLPDALYERLVKLTKLMDDTYNKLQNIQQTTIWKHIMITSSRSTET